MPHLPLHPNLQHHLCSAVLHLCHPVLKKCPLSLCHRSVLPTLYHAPSINTSSTQPTSPFPCGTKLIEDDWFFPGCSDPALATRQQELEEELAQARGLGQHRAKKLAAPAQRSLQVGGRWTLLRWSRRTVGHLFVVPADGIKSSIFSKCANCTTSCEKKHRSD